MTTFCLPVIDILIGWLLWKYPPGSIMWCNYYVITTGHTMRIRSLSKILIDGLVACYWRVWQVSPLWTILIVFIGLWNGKLVGWSFPSFTVSFFFGVFMCFFRTRVVFQVVLSWVFFILSHCKFQGWHGMEIVTCNLAEYTNLWSRVVSIDGPPLP